MAVQSHAILQATTGDLAIITGQKPAITRARKSIAAFKLREGMPVGVAKAGSRRSARSFALASSTGSPQA